MAMPIQARLQSRYQMLAMHLLQLQLRLLASVPWVVCLSSYLTLFSKLTGEGVLAHSGTGGISGHCHWSTTLPAPMNTVLRSWASSCHAGADLTGLAGVALHF